MFLRGFWIPPIICGLITIGCAARLNSRMAYYDGVSTYMKFNSGQFVNNAESMNNKNDSDSTNGKKESDKEFKSQMDRVAEIMRVTSESVVETLSNILKK